MMLQPKSTADIIADHPDILLRYAQQPSVEVLLLMWRLVRLMHGQAVRGRIVISDQPARFKANARVPVEPKFALDDVRCISEGRRGIALRDRRRKGLIAIVILVNDRGRRIKRHRRIANRRKLGPFDDDVFRRVFCLSAATRGDRNHRFSLPACRVRGERRLHGHLHVGEQIVRAAPGFHDALQIRSRDDANHTGHRRRLRYIDRHDPRIRVR